MRVVVKEDNGRFYPIKISDGCDLNLGEEPTKDDIDAALTMMALIGESEEITLGSLRSFIKKSNDKDTFNKQKEAQWIIITQRGDGAEPNVDSKFSYGDKGTCQRDIDLLFG